MANSNSTKKCYTRKPNFLSLEELQALKEEILESPYLGTSQLSDRFVSTKGFSVVFKRSGISQVEQNFPYFKPYLEKALMPVCNAFYLNPLVLEGNSCIEEHVDCSLSSYFMEWVTPRLVSVLYICVPNDLQGGQLILQEDKSVWHVEPETNTLVHFLGWVLHSVTPVQTGHARMSLICEQYNLPEEYLIKVPEFEIKSSSCQDLVE